MNNQVILTPYFFERFSPGLQKLSQPGWLNNQELLPPGKIQEQVVPLYHKIAGFVEQTAAGGNIPISVAGDCCAAIPVAAGLRQAGIQSILIWLDAHGDFNTWETTPSGFLGGMPLAMLVGRGEQSLLEAVNLTPLPEEDVILCDGRDLDPGERKALDNSQIVRLENILDLPDHPRLLGKALHVHFDTDIVDSREMPAMNYPVQGGPTTEEVERVFRRLQQTGRVAAVSVSTWNPELAGADISQELTDRLTRILTGELR